MSTTNPSNSIELRLTSDPAQVAPARRAVEELAQRCGFDETAIGQIGLCVNEALANIIRHAYDNRPGMPVAVEACCRGSALVMSIRDWGSGQTPPEPCAEAHDPLTPGGLGLICMKQMMDSVEYRPQPDGMLLTMTLRKKAAPTTERS